MKFNHLSQRSIHYFIATYSKFSPIENTQVSKESQKKAYDFIKNIYLKVYEQPELFIAKQQPDEAYGRWEFNKAKPGLDIKIRNSIVKLEKIVATFFEVCLNGEWQQEKVVICCKEVKDTASLKKMNKLGADIQKLSEEFHIYMEKELFDGLHLLADISNDFFNEVEYKSTPYVLFSRGVFHKDSNFNEYVFSNSCNNSELLLDMILYLEENGYERIANREYANRISKITLDYVKFHDPKDKKLADNWNVRTHSGIELVYDELKEDNFALGVRIPYFKQLLNQIEDASVSTKKFIIHHTKKCDGCGYCVQTDKTGTRPLVAIPVEEHMLCPYFPGFSYKFFELDANLIKNIKELLMYIEHVVAQKKLS